MEKNLITIQIDPVGQGEKVVQYANVLSLEIEPAIEKHLDGSNLLNVTGNVASIISFINMLTGNLSKPMMIAISIGGVVVLVTAKKAIELIQKKASSAK